MPANIVLDQVTLGPGTAGESRNDGVTGQLVTCSNATVEGNYTWTLVDTPIRSAVPRGTVSTSATFTFTPDVKGTYLVSLQVNNSVSPSDNQSLVFRVKSAGAFTLNWSYLAAGETTEDNATFAGLGFTGDTNFRGWATERDLQLEEVENAVARVQQAITAFAGTGTDHIVKVDSTTGQIDAGLIGAIPGSAYDTVQHVTGATDTLVTTNDITFVIGGFTLDPSQYTASTVAYSFAALGTMLDSLPGAGVLTLADMGAVGAPTEADIRSTLAFSGNLGEPRVVSQTLTPVVSPSGANEIANTERVYEIRLTVTTSGAFNCVWSGLLIDSTA